MNNLIKSDADILFSFEHKDSNTILELYCLYGMFYCEKYVNHVLTHHFKSLDYSIVLESYKDSIMSSLDNLIT